MDREIGDDEILKFHTKKGSNWVEIQSCDEEKWLTCDTRTAINFVKINPSTHVDYVFFIGFNEYYMFIKFYSLKSRM